MISCTTIFLNLKVLGKIAINLERSIETHVYKVGFFHVHLSDTKFRINTGKIQ